MVGLQSTTALLCNALRVFVPLSILLTTYVYLYPVFLGCAFPLPPPQTHSLQDSFAEQKSLAAFFETLRLHLPSTLASTIAPQGQLRRPVSAPFRLLALGDPQLEGDTSIPNAHSDSAFPHFYSVARHLTSPDSGLSVRERVRLALHDAVDFWFLDIPTTLESARKRLDLFGNDFYLAHIVRTMRWWAVPTHVSVLGDLLGSQWIEDDEYEKRAGRYWNRVFRHAERVPDELALYPADEYGLAGYLGASTPTNGTQWAARVINVAGNHDIGYSGDITEDRLSRFERLFGKANYELRFELPLDCLSSEAAALVFDENTNPDSDRLVPELRIVNLNDMNLDTPALSSDIQDRTYGFINAVINTASAVEFKGHFTLLLTHIPLYKPEGTCVDAPYFSFHDDAGTLKEQNLLSEDASRGFLEGIFGMHADVNAPANGRGRRGAILNGHDHEGCDTYHFVNQSRGDDPSTRGWEATRWNAAVADGLVGRAFHPGIREITLRSMMGDFGGNAGLFSAWFDEEAWEWRFDFSTCSLGRQHLWWAVHILDLTTALGLLAYGVLRQVLVLQGSNRQVAGATAKLPVPKTDEPKGAKTALHANGPVST